MRVTTLDPSQATGDGGCCIAMEKVEFRCLQYAIPPVLVMGVATVLFELLGFGFGELPASIGVVSGAAGDQVGLLLGESRSRVVWSATVLLFYAVAAATVLGSWSVVRHSVPAGRRSRLWGAAVVLALLSIGSMAISAGMAGPQSRIFFFTLDSIAEWGRFAPGQVTAVGVAVNVVNLLAAVVPAIATVAVCSALAIRDERELTLELLEERARHLRVMLGLSSALMVSGILHMMTWLGWPAAMVEDPAVAAKVLALGEGVGIYWGVTYTLIITALILPPEIALHRKAAQLWAEMPEAARGDVGSPSLKKRGFQVGPWNQIAHAGAILAPLLAGPVGSALVQLAAPVAN